MLGEKGAKIVPTVKHTIIIISIFLAPTRSDNLPIMTVMTAPETMYAVITQDAKMEKFQSLELCSEELVTSQY